MSLKRPHSSPPQSSSDVFASKPITDRSSTFVAHFSPTQSVNALQASADFAAASHRITAWRRRSAQRSLSSTSSVMYESGHDDDGEKHGGRTLERLLQNTKVEGSVVVARWYGGVMLGPVRFTHMENCARDAIGKSRALATQGSQKRQRGDDGVFVGSGVDRNKLEQVLQKRDQSIVVLRQLLVENKGQGQAASGGQIQSPAKAVEYSKMPEETLKRLDKARDSTIAWLLKEIEKTEATPKYRTSKQEHTTFQNVAQEKGSSDDTERLA